MSKVSLVALKVSTKKLKNLVYCYVQKIAVMTYKKECTFIINKEFFKPVTGFYIKVVCRFVQKQNVWILHKRLCKRNTHLPSAGKFFCLARQVIMRKSQSKQNAFRSCFPSVPPAFFKPCNQFSLLNKKIFCRIRIFCSLLTHFINLLLKFIPKSKSPVRFFFKRTAMMS